MQPTYPAHIDSLKAYIPGLPISDLSRRTGIPESNIAKLASNENPLGPSLLALQALASSTLDLSLYPDNECTSLVNTLSAELEVPPEWIIVGAGSEGVLANAVATLLEVGRKTAFSQYSFQAYVNAVQRVGAVPIVVPSPHFTVDLVGLQNSLSQSPSLVYIANPGNPTGTTVPPEQLEQFLRSVPSNIVVLLDEAYFEYVPDALRLDSIRLVRELPNLLVTRTFSKAYGLAGLRVGYGVAQPVLMEALRKARAPFTVTETAQLAAAAAIQDKQFLSKTVEHNERVKGILEAGLRAMGIAHLKSQTNFLLAEVGDGAALAKRLEQHGLIVRPVAAYGLPKWLRISIGTEEQAQRLLQAMKTELKV